MIECILQKESLAELKLQLNISNSSSIFQNQPHNFNEESNQSSSFLYANITKCLEMNVRTQTDTFKNKHTNWRIIHNTHFSHNFILSEREV